MRSIVAHILKSCFRLLPVALIIAFIVSVIGPSPAMASPGWYNNSWLYRKKITIDCSNVTATLTDFPVLISLASDSDLASYARSDGYDILFTAADEITKLSHEIESYNSATGELVAWVKIPSLSSVSNTDIYMYYGNAGAANQQNATSVWDGNFKMVQHLEETVSGPNAIKDSTINNNNGTDQNSPILGAVGQINSAITFDGTNDYIDCGDINEVDSVSVLTFEAWAEPLTGVGGPIISKYTDPTHRTHIWVQGTTIYWNISNSANSYATSTVTLDTWHHFAMVFDGSQSGNANRLKCYLDGVLQAVSFVDTIPATTANHAENLLLGKQDISFFSGTIDEARISNSARSADWIQTGYNNQSNPPAFFSLGPPQNAPVAPAVIGGKVFSVNKSMVLAPWLLMAATFSLVIVQLVQYLRKKTPSRPPPGKNL